VLWVFGSAETGMDGRSGDVDTQPQPCQTALALHPGGQPGSMGQLNPLHGPAQQKGERLDHVSRLAERYLAAELPAQRREVQIGAVRTEQHGVALVLRNFPARQRAVERQVNRRGRPGRGRWLRRDADGSRGSGSPGLAVRQDHAGTSSASTTFSPPTQRRLTPVSASCGSSTRKAPVRASRSTKPTGR
jgi:hypothetical protein